MEAFINWIQNTVAQYIATHMILELCEEVEKHMGAWVFKKLWDQELTNLAGVQVEEETSVNKEEIDGALGEG